MNCGKLRLSMIAVATSVIFIVGTGCAHKKTRDEESASPAIESQDMGNSDAGNALGLKTVNFEYDSSLLSSGAKSALKNDAKILKENANVTIQIEGHCDARGGIQYNLALGQKRADSVQHFLSDLGVSKARLTTISYGKERPLVTGDSEDAYLKNRRANLVITKK